MNKNAIVVSRRAMQKAAVAGSALLPLFALADGDPAGAITSAQTTVLAIVAAGGAAMIAVALGGIGWGVGVKMIKKLRGAA